ncbi:integral membrane [Fusarium acutatum]|uniref:Integral membrane n=1 Tax=Fusarium acutatum TaxID=78861 RepID=A0A8H4K6F7_9HYPO|nr:integral membrane [Fusarium acutatum]
MASVQPPNPLPPDQNVGPILLGISGTCLALVIITTSVRIWVRTALRSSGWDDYTIVIVTLLGIARFGVQVGQTKISVWALMSLGLVATGFGIARATSLGVVTSDLSSIWSNLELYLGIVGANLALSRSIFAYFFREGGTTKGSSKFRKL